jgi:hypothetical protein
LLPLPFFNCHRMFLSSYFLFISCCLSICFLLQSKRQTVYPIN